MRANANARRRVGVLPERRARSVRYRPRERPLDLHEPILDDQTVTVLSAGGLAHAHVPEDRGELGYRIDTSPGRTKIEIVDLATLTKEGTPTSPYLMSCRADSVNAGLGTTFDSPNRGTDGSFVRIELVDLRRAFCGRGLIQ